MATKDEIARDIIQKQAEGKMVSFKLPNSQFLIALERKQVDEAVALLSLRDDGDRASVMAIVRKAIKRTLKRERQGRATREDMDAMAADAALWIANESIEGRLEQHITDAQPDLSELRSKMN